MIQVGLFLCLTQCRVLIMKNKNCSNSYHQNDLFPHGLFALDSVLLGIGFFPVFSKPASLQSFGEESLENCCGWGNLDGPTSTNIVAICLHGPGLRRKGYLENEKSCKILLIWLSGSFSSQLPCCQLSRPFCRIYMLSLLYLYNERDYKVLKMKIGDSENLIHKVI